MSPPVCLNCRGPQPHSWPECIARLRSQPAAKEERDEPLSAAVERARATAIEEVAEYIRSMATDGEDVHLDSLASAIAEISPPPPAGSAPAPGAIDEHAIPGVPLRFRWCPPSESTPGFWLGETPVTQALWAAVMGTNPSRFVGPDRPVERVSWDECTEFISRLNALVPGLDARLPTEAEWEYACRAGTTGDRYGDLDEIAWYAGNSGSMTHPVGKKQPNKWGFYDMHGNVKQWCSDAVDSSRVLRGSSWLSPAQLVRAAFCLWIDPGSGSASFGFRLARGQGTDLAAEPGEEGGAKEAPGSVAARVEAP